MIKNDYDVELNRLNQMDSVAIPHLKSVQMVVKNRVNIHSYEPIIYDHLKTLSDEPSLPDDLTKLRDGNSHDDILQSSYPNVQINEGYATELGHHVRYLKICRNDQITSNKAIIYLHGGA